jgi:beta-galactosidase
MRDWKMTKNSFNSSRKLPLGALLLIVGWIIVTGSFVLAADYFPRQQTRIDDGWTFFLGDPSNAASSGFDDTGWRAVTLPHDWSIEGKMDPHAPMGGHGGFLPAGIGWYRHHFDAPATWKDKQVRVEFEGVYMNADVYLNGQKLMSHPYGFTSFFVDLTSALKVGSSNLLAVRVDNSQHKNARWYTGSGIYRHVLLYVTNPVQVAPWGVFVSVPRADTNSATVSVQTDVLNHTKAATSARIQSVVLAPDGSEIGRTESSLNLPASGQQQVNQELTLKNPPLWFPETPQLSSVVVEVIVDGKTVDKVTTPFGVRALAWSATAGLTLNGKTYKLSGGCIHDDNGVLGACAFDRAEERKIQLLKAAGFNALRMAHNPPSPELLDACDRLGMLVLDEAFDCWANGKSAYDYHLIFKDWWQRDLDSMIERDRNHPSVVMWSIGNEIPGLFSDMGGEYGPKLAAEIHSLDRTRPVTNGILGWPVDPKKPGKNDADNQKNADANWNSLDIVGSNYHLAQHVAQHDQFPERILVSTESFPPIGEAYAMTDHPYVVGDFVWAAQDYLGEVGVGRWFYEGDPTEPVVPRRGQPPTKLFPISHGSDTLYPWRGANPGNLDLIGNSKPAAHLRNIAWDMGERLYMAVRQPADDKKIIVAGWGWYPVWENWTWPGREGKLMGVDVYSRYEKVRLYLNDKLVGEAPTTRANNFQATFTLPYQPGTLKAVGVENGHEAGSVQLETVGDPAAIRLTPDRTEIKADGQDLSFVQIEVVDKNGNLQPNADELVTFTLTGAGTIAGLGNANLDSTEPFQGTQCHVYHGKAMIVLRASEQPGTLDLKAKSSGLSPAETTLPTE